MLIYKIVNQINGDFYIGKTTKPKEERLQKHFYSVNYNSQTYLHRAIRKYGEINFTIEEVETQLPQEQLDGREVFWIQELNPPYNMTKGGEGGDTSKSPNFIKAIKKQHSNRLPESYASYGMLGKKQSKKFHEAIKKANSYPVVCEGKSFHQLKKQRNIIKV